MDSPGANDVSQKNIRIMVVEDVDFNRDILTDILAERGWQIIPATSGEAALDILAQDTDFHIILMDIGLPGIDGIETTVRIKANPACRTIPVIALTAETTDERERLLAAGLDGYAEKNFDPDQLFAAIGKHLTPACGTQQKSEPALSKPTEDCDLDFEALFANYPEEKALCRIAKAFFHDADQELALLGEAMANGDQTKILACCHNLSGAAAVFTARKLSLAAQELHDCIRDGRITETDSIWQKIQSAHASLYRAVTSRLNLSGHNE